MGCACYMHVLKHACCNMRAMHPQCTRDAGAIRVQCAVHRNAHCNAHAVGQRPPAEQLRQPLVVVLLHGEPEAGAADELMLLQSGDDVFMPHRQRRVSRTGSVVVLVVQLRANAQDVLNDAQVALASSRDERRRGVARALLVRRAPVGEGGFQLVEVARARVVHDHLWFAHPAVEPPA